MSASKLLSVDGSGAAQMSLLQQRLTQAELTANNAKDGKAKPGTAHDKEIEAAATQFEGMLVQQMLKEMWATVPKSGLLSGSHEEEVYQEMFQESLSEHISKKQSIGVKDVIIRDIKATEARNNKGTPGSGNGAS